jgi:hypothetical protein
VERELSLFGLLWRRRNKTMTLTRLKGVAPSWSWASVVGRLEYRDVALKTSNYKGQNLEILECSVREEFEGTYGCLHPDSEGTLRVTGIPQEVTVDCQSHPGERKRQYQECAISSGFISNENVFCTLDEFLLPSPHYCQFWCLRVGSYNAGGREGDVFLLLERTTEGTDEFRCVGFAETDAWFNSSSPAPNSGIFISSSLQMLTIQ